MIRRNRLTLVCDSCGESLPTELDDATELRTFAAVKGWQYRVFKIRNPQLDHPRPADPYARTHKMVRRTWDGCPSCPVPESGEGIPTAARKPYEDGHAVG